MTRPEERRRYRRVAAGVRVYYGGEPLDRRERKYLEGVAADLSLGGMFLATDHPLPPGSLVWLELQPRPRAGEEDDGEQGIRAKAVVRWSRRWRKPHGMGLEFVEFEGLGQRELATVMERLLVDWGGRSPSEEPDGSARPGDAGGSTE